MAYYGSYSNEKITIEQLEHEAFNEQHDYVPNFIHYYNADEIRDSDLRFFGIEMEFSVPNGRRSASFNILQEINTSPMFYSKYDGSIEYGMELNSHPMTLKFLEALPNMDDVLSDSNLNADDRCGLHIHINRTSFKNTDSIKNFYTNILVTRKLMLWLSKRKRFAQIKRYADLCLDSNTLDKYEKGLDKFTQHRKVMDGKFDKFQRDIEKIVNNELSGTKGRYTGVNFTNSNTIEIRFLQGTKDWGLIMNYIRLFNFIADISNKGVVVSSPYELVKLSMGTNIFEWLKAEHDTYVEMLEKVAWLDKNNYLYVDSKQNLFYRVPSKMANKFDYVLTLNDCEHAIDQWERYPDSSGFDDNLLSRVAWMNTERGRMKQNKDHIILRRVKTVAFVRETTFDKSYIMVKRFVKQHQQKEKIENMKAQTINSATITSTLNSNIMRTNNIDWGNIFNNHEVVDNQDRNSDFWDYIHLNFRSVGGASSWWVNFDIIEGLPIYYGVEANTFYVGSAIALAIDNAISQDIIDYLNYYLRGDLRNDVDYMLEAHRMGTPFHNMIHNVSGSYRGIPHGYNVLDVRADWINITRAPEEEYEFAV